MRVWITAADSCGWSEFFLVWGWEWGEEDSCVTAQRRGRWVVGDAEPREGGREGEGEVLLLRRRRIYGGWGSNAPRAGPLPPSLLCCPLRVTAYGRAVVLRPFVLTLKSNKVYRKDCVEPLFLWLVQASEVPLQVKVTVEEEGRSSQFVTAVTEMAMTKAVAVSDVLSFL
ncbi:hypothetical protein PR202_ga11460 [Eleusine coracana subsp. coracana]|uniref:Uncharacterized protein n=1 Tax=Eleusine coracana subsp. coracana TaxID=191504 RepID=A0AAV5C8Z6_ELECO|nr:hypothetical protein PR202_ga11460 [Eleusine coracana subsp. coracana]